MGIRHHRGDDIAGINAARGAREGGGIASRLSAHAATPRMRMA